MRTDVFKYYESVNHSLLLACLDKYVKDRDFMRLINLYLRRSLTWGGLYKDFTKGLSRGCSLSPLLGGVYLYELDQTLGLFTIRYMDDVLILAPTRWKLRRAIALLNQHFEQLGLKQHPDKTEIGRIENGFDFLGYHYTNTQLTVAKATVDRFLQRCSRLYEQKCHTPRGGAAFESYIHRWAGWAAGGLA